MAVSQVRNVLMQEISCSLCLDVFNEPKKLPACDHVFCKGCLEMLAKRNVTAAVSCPECRKVSKLPDGNVKDLPTAFRVNRLIDAFRQVELEEKKKEEEKKEEVKQTTRTVPATQTNLKTASTAPASGVGDACDGWVEIGSEVLAEATVDDTHTGTGVWQRMCRVRERERETEPPAQQQNTRRATSFSQFFSQLKSECKTLVRGIREGIRPSSSQQSTPQPQRPRSATQGNSPSIVERQSSQVQRANVSPSVTDEGPATQLLRARNQEIGQLHQQLQTKSQLEQQHKQNVDQLKRYNVQMELENDNLKRQLQELCVHSNVEHGSPSMDSQRSRQPDFVIALPNTLVSRLIARHPNISQKLIAYAKSRNVEVYFNQTESCYQALLCGANPQAFDKVRDQLSSLDHQLQTKLEVNYQQMHCAILPLLLDQRVSKALSEIEMQHNVSIHIADNCGTIASIDDFVQLLRSESDGRLLTTADLKNISTPDTRIPVDYKWIIKRERGNIALPDPVNKYLNEMFFSRNIDNADFEYNGMHYTANVSLMCIREVETSIQMGLDIEIVPPLWSYAISDSDYVAHEVQDSTEIENMFRYGGSSITLAGSKHTLDLKTMHQIDLETGQNLAVKRVPALERPEAPQYFVTLGVRGLRNSLGPASKALQRKLISFCATKAFAADLLPTVPEHWQEIIMIQSLNTARHYCLKIEQHSLDNGKVTIQMKGEEGVLSRVHSLLKEQCLECQYFVVSQLPPPSTPPEHNYPPEWASQDSDFKLFTVHHRSQEWEFVNGLMKQSLKKFKVNKLQRIQNRQHWDKYTLEMKHMSKRNGGNVNEMCLFHGTRDVDPNMIIQSVRGIDFRYSRRDNQLLWGTGAYFAVNASYSDRYCHIKTERLNLRQLLLVKVLTGRSCDYDTKADPSLTKPPPLPENRLMLHDTVTGYTNGSRVYIVYDHDRAYPTYLITYYTWD